MLIRSAIVIVLVVLAGYGIIEAIPLVSGPSLSIDTATLASTTSNGIVTVEGSAKRVSELALDGAPLLPDDSGRFATVIVLPQGGAILTLTATDRFGRTIIRQEPVYVP